MMLRSCFIALLLLSISTAGCISDTEIEEFTTEYDLEGNHSNLVEYLYGSEGLPVELPINFSLNVSLPAYENNSNIERIDEIEINSRYNTISIAYHFIPSNNTNEKLIIYHQGHLGGIELGKEAISFFLSNGFSVIGYAMPLRGPNVVDSILLPNGVNHSLPSMKHAELSILEEFNVSAIPVFVDPIIIGLNYIEEYYNYSHISMVGLSGGGWTTVLSSALDARISYSYPVAGSVPFDLRDEKETNADFEQNQNRTIYSISNYIDLYTMGSSGLDRKQIQIFNSVDPCCYYSGGRESKIHDYRDEIVFRGGNFDVYFDEENDGHEISHNSLNFIRDNIARFVV